jgi:hypothetical protein
MALPPPLDSGGEGKQRHCLWGSGKADYQAGGIGFPTPPPAKLTTHPRKTSNRGWAQTVKGGGQDNDTHDDSKNGRQAAVHRQILTTCV